MTLENRIHKHYEPTEYAEGLREFKERCPDKYNFLHRAVQKAQDSNVGAVTQEKWLEVLHKGIKAYEDDMTHDQYEMFSNLYLCVEKQVYKE